MINTSNLTSSASVFSGIDLHTHTNASDGQLSPQALLQQALDNGTTMLAITDHDTIDGYLAIYGNVVHHSSLRLISGVELSTQWQGMGIHVVGLNFSVRHPAMVTLLAQQRTVRQQRGLTILNKLAKIGIFISEAELKHYVGQGQIGRPHIAQLMLDKGYVNSIDKAFKKYLGAGKVGDVRNRWSGLAESVAAIRAAGGVAVIAHPNHYQMTRTKLLRLIDEFIAAGGQGIEVISGRQHNDITQKYSHIANDKGLYASVGSDFHRYLMYAPSIGELAPLPDAVTPIWTLFQ